MRVRRAISLVAIVAVAAPAVIVLGAVAVGGWSGTRDQLHRSVANGEVALFTRAPGLLKVVSPSASDAERNVWRFLVAEFSRSPQGRALPIGVNPLTSWSNPQAQRAAELYDRVTAGSPNSLGDPRIAFAVHDFIVKNAKPAPLKAHDLPTSARLIPHAVLLRETEPRDGWQRFVERRGVVAYLSMSRVGFTPRRDRALVYLELDCGPLCGYGAYFILEKHANNWEIKKQQVTWVS
jgi:hypothetical protein